MVFRRLKFGWVKIVLVAVTFGMISLATCMLLFWAPEDNFTEEMDVRGGRIVPTDSEKSERQQRKMAELGKILLSSSVDRSASDIEGDVGIPTMDELEARRLSERMNKISSIYWEKAPQVLEQMLQEELPNDYWRNKVEKYADEMLKNDIYQGTELEEIDCRITLCKAVMHHVDKEAFDVYRRNATQVGPWLSDQHGTHEDFENGEIRSTMFFAKEGGDPEPFNKMQERLLEIVENSEAE